MKGGLMLQSKESPPAFTKYPCSNCGSKAWWYREPRMIFNEFYSPGEWLCGRCHPDPNAEIRKEESNG